MTLGHPKIQTDARPSRLNRWTQSGALIDYARASDCAVAFHAQHPSGFVLPLKCVPPMRFRCHIAVCFLVISLPGAAGTAVSADEARAEAQPVDFSREVLPILSNKCFVCHGPDREASDEVQLDSFEEATAEHDGHRAINPDDPEQSQILIRIHSVDDPMPPADAEKQLTDGERDILTRWVKQGGEYTSHWAFVVPQKHSPAGLEVVKPRDVIDAFVEDGLQAANIDFAVDADRRTLARRAALVLTGLPPDPEQLEAFMAEEGDDGFERFVEALLASPRFGEHQARYWLDAVRYGDTHGLHLDNRRGIYPYRDWVVHAFNQNLPLDKFIIWQLAGDLLPHPTLEQLVATGFVRMNPTTAEGGAIAEEFQAKNNFDRVENFGTIFLGMSLTCARCHSHKYDPIPQVEYYELMAFFNSTAESSLDGNSYDYAPAIKAPARVSDWKAWTEVEDARAELLEQAANLLVQREDFDPELRDQWTKATDAERLAMIVADEGPFAGHELQGPSAELSDRIAEFESTFTTTLVAHELLEPRVTRMLQRGEYDLPLGEPLEPDVLAVLGGFPEGAPRNRLGLAQWLTSPDNPLVSRVLINRIWQQTFGRGLVRSPEEFGLQGEQPTHPQLLDWLAVELQESGWDMKHMLREMVMSRTFRKSSVWRAGVDDPEKKLLARGPGHRLDAEVIRDIGLWASGLLDDHMGGEGVKPYQPSGLWEALMHPASNTREYVSDDGPEQYRRSLYVYWKRTSPHPMMTLFDAPSRESSCVRRSRTNTPLQSLGLLNENQRVEMARVLAARLMKAATTDSERLDQLYLILTSREPTDHERSVCLNLLQSQLDHYASSESEARGLVTTGDLPHDDTLPVAEHAAWTQLTTALLASDAAILLY